MRYNNLKIALVDDDKRCRDEMAALCQSFGNTHCCHIEIVPFADGGAFLAALSDNDFSVVFMDIYMEGIDGIATALRLREHDYTCILVFLTTSGEFMPDAFSCHAFEYMIKPVTRERLFRVLLDAIRILPRSGTYIELASGRRSIPVFPDNIISVVTDAHYLCIALADGEALRCRMTMSEFLERTGQDARFLRVNKGIVVNADRVISLADSCCVMENGAHYPIRVRDRAKIEQVLHDYHFQKIRQSQTLAARHTKEESS